ncbi:MAG: hypothetical protein U0T82_09855 [Bacteroidales bacterium]
MKRTLRTMMVILMIVPGLITNKLAGQGESEKASPFFVNMDLVSRYLWRGTDFGNAPQVQPTVKFATGGFTAGAWGSYSLLGNYQEADLFASYTLPFGLSVGLTDYYFPIGNNDSTYFSKGHYAEANLGFTGGGFSFSANAILSTPAKTNDLYFEAGYTYKNLSVFAGAGNEAYTLDGKFNICNVGLKMTKEIKVTESFSIPVYGSLILNPDKEQVNLVVGVSF